MIEMDKRKLENVKEIEKMVADVTNLSWIVEWTGENNCITEQGRFKAPYISMDTAEAEEIIRDKFTTDMILELDRRLGLGVQDQVEDRIKYLREGR